MPELSLVQRFRLALLCVDVHDSSGDPDAFVGAMTALARYVRDEGITPQQLAPPRLSLAESQEMESAYIASKLVTDTATRFGEVLNRVRANLDRD